MANGGTLAVSKSGYFRVDEGSPVRNFEFAFNKIKRKEVEI